MGLIWLKHPVLWHSSRVPSGYDYSKMTEEQKKLIVTKWHNWYTADWDYAQTTVIFFCVGIGLLGFFNAIFLLSNTRKRANISMVQASRPSLFERTLGLFRWFTNRQLFYRGGSYYWRAFAATMGYWRDFDALNYYSHSVGVWSVIGLIFIFVMVLLLAAKPYYWPSHEMGHSPPIATRAGWISIAIMPFMIAFATKVNWIGALVGTSHEKLQVYHRWTALFMYITSLVHTFPFIINNIAMGEMSKNYNTSPWYWTGIAALLPQTWLVFTSWGIIRNPYYEVFKKLHFTAASIFMAALWIHCNFRLTSWDYFWATAALYGSTYCFRFGRTLYNSNIFGIPSSVDTYPNNIIRVSIHVPERVKWSPGQHVFLRFLDAGIHAFTSHPFTIASVRGGKYGPMADSLLPVVDGNSACNKVPAGRSTLDVFFRIRGGSTRSFARSLIDHGGQSRVWVDGPYGGLPVSFDKFDTVLLLSGGIGSTFTLPILMDLVNKLVTDNLNCKVYFVVTVRKKETLAWMNRDLAIAENAAAEHGIHLQIHVTDTLLLRNHASKESIDIEGELDNEPLLPGECIRYERPDFPGIIRSICTNPANGRIAIAACGPDSLLYDVRNAVAAEELKIATGKATNHEVFLHTEHYSW